MRVINKDTVQRLAALGLAVGLTVGFVTAGIAQTVSGSAYGSSFENLVVAGVPVTTGDAAVAPNTQMSLPGVGYVVLNEQIPTGDGVTSSGLTVNMIHVYLQSITGGTVDPLTGQVIGGILTTTGEIIVGSATSSVAS